MEETENLRKRKRQCSKELLQPPKGPGVRFLLDELGKDKISSGPPRIFRVEKSSALSRVRSFLPQLKHADSVLQQRMKEEPQKNVDIENVADGQPCIEMDLALIPIPPDVQESVLESSSESSDSSSDSDTEHGTGDGEETLTFPLKLKPGRTRKKRAGIEELTGER